MIVGLNNGYNPYLPDKCKDCGIAHNRATQDCKIPQAPYYVMSFDRFFSDWHFNGGLRNTPVVPCADWYEVERVLDYVLSRKDQKNVRVVTAKPRHRAGRVLNIVSGWCRPKSERTDD